LLSACLHTKLAITCHPATTDATNACLNHVNQHVAHLAASAPLASFHGDGLDLLSYVEFQRNYLACVRTHKAALMMQRAFWNCLLRDTISFRDLQVRLWNKAAKQPRLAQHMHPVQAEYPVA
jgi:hypothetical protein